MKTLQIRNVPDAMHRKLKERALRSGVSLSEFVLNELREVSELLTPAEFSRRMQSREPPELPLDSVATLRAERSSRS
ncbi:MAG: hypothetical protein HS115_03365 [Spirochaetales bacterium]|nr:hypothetical protein [Spirochaetales bacterium]